MLNELQEIPLADWPALRDKYLADWPKYTLGYSTIDNFIKWFEKRSHINNCKVYSLNGDWSDGTFVIVNRFQVYFNTLTEDQSRLVAALSLLDPSKFFLLYGFNDRIKPAACEYLTKLGIEPRPDQTAFYKLSKEDALNLDVNPPEGFTVNPLSVADARLINSVWPHKHNASLYFIKSMIAHNPSAGVYTSNGELIAWCLRQPNGALGMLQVRNEYRRQGFGQLVAKAISKRIAETGSDVYSPIVVANKPSRSMFEKIGFVEVDSVYWMEKPAASDAGLWKTEYDSDSEDN